MTASEVDVPGVQAPPGRLWIVRGAVPYLQAAVLGFLPCPDLVSRYRMRRAAHRLVTLRNWPDMEAKSDQVAQLALMRLLWLQRQTRRAVRGRHREAAVMLARASVETLFLGLYCLRVPSAVTQLHSGNLKALGDGFAYVEETSIVPAQVIRDCVARLGRHPQLRRHDARPRRTDPQRVLALAVAEIPADINELPTGAGDDTGNSLQAGVRQLPTTRAFAATRRHRSVSLLLRRHRR